MQTKPFTPIAREEKCCSITNSLSFQLLDLCDIKLKPCSSIIYQKESQLPVYSIVVRIQSISRMYSATFSHIYGNSSRIASLWEGHLVKARIYWIPRRAKWEAGAHVIFKHKLLSSGPFGPKHLGWEPKRMKAMWVLRLLNKRPQGKGEYN